MKFVRLVYFHVYNSYYKNGDYKNDIPHLTAFGLVGCAFSIFLVVLIITIHHLLTHDRLSKLGIGAMTIIFLSFFAYQFLLNSSYQKIYEEFRNSKLDRPVYKVLAWLAVITGFAFAGLYAYIFNQPNAK